MDSVDAAQQEALNHLSEAAKENRRTDLAQWLVIVVVALGLSVYVSLLLGSALKLQGETIQRITERCGS